MASPKKRSRAVVTVVCALLAVCLAAALVFFGLAKRKLSALQTGADFDLIYGVTAQSSTAPALYTILEQAGATAGRVTGLYSPGQLQLYLYSNTARTTETSGDNFFTDVYIDADQTLFNAGQLYRTLRQSVVSRYPLAGALLPDWTLGSYISQNQLAQVLGVQTAQTALQPMSGFSLKLDPRWIVHTDYDTQGFTYFQLPAEGANAPTVVLGLPLKSLLFDESIPVDVHVTIPAHGVSVTLNGVVRAAVNSLSAPTDCIADSDIQSFVQLRQTLEQIAQTIQTTLNALQ